MSIQGRLNELNSIKNELKSLRARSSQLRNRAKNIEDEINQYLDSKDQPGLKYKGVAIMRENKTKRKYKRPKDKDTDALGVLENHGVSNAQDVLKELMEARKGSPAEYRKLKFKSYKSKK